MKDILADGRRATGCRSASDGSQGSCSDFGGAKDDEGVACALPARYGTRVCFRAAVKEGDTVLGQSSRSCGTITRRGQNPT